MLEISDQEVRIHLCTFEIYFKKAKVNLRFPALFFVQLKSMNSKTSVSMAGRKKAVDSVVQIDETLTLTTEMIYHKSQQKYLKKQCLINLNLISNNRPEQIKLVGRVTIDLSNIANNDSLSQVSTFKMMYCSVEGDISLKAKLTRSIESNMFLNQLDKSSFNDLYSFTGPKAEKKNKFDLKETLSEKKSSTERRRQRMKLDQKEEVISKNGILSNNILIEDQPEGNNNLMLNSTPISEEKYKPKQHPQMMTKQQQQKTDQFFNKEKNLLQRQLGEHKNRIKKLENDIMAAMKMFEESQINSQIQKSKLMEKEQTLNEFLQRENQLKDQHEQQITKLKEQFKKEIDMLKTSYDADLKLLQATLEEQRIKQESSEKTDKKLIQDLKDAKKVIEEQSGAIESFTLLKEEINCLNEEKFALQLDVQNKADELASLKDSLTQKQNQPPQQLPTSTANEQLQARIQQLEEKISFQKLKNDELSQSKEAISADYEEKLFRINGELTAAQQKNIQLEGKNVPQDNSQTIKITQKNSELQETIKVQDQKLKNILTQLKRLEDQKIQFQKLKNEEILKQKEILLAEYEEKLFKVRGELAAAQDTLSHAATISAPPQDNPESIRNTELEQLVKVQDQKLKNSEAQLLALKDSYECKMDDLLKQLANFQAQNEKLAQMTANHLNIKQLADQQTLQRCQQLQQQIIKIAEQNQALRSSKVEDESASKIREQKEQLQAQYFLLDEKAKLQQMDLLQLKKERETLQQTMNQLVLEHQQLKSSINREPAHKPEEVTNQEVVSLKVQVQNYQTDKQNLKTEIEVLKAQLQQKNIYLDQLREEVSKGKQNIEQAPLAVPVQKDILDQPFEDIKTLPIRVEDFIPIQEQEIVQQEYIVTEEPLQKNLNYSEKPEQKHEQKLDSPGQAEERHDFNFENIGQHLTAEDINSMTQPPKNTGEDQGNALKEENMRLREQIQQIKAQKQITMFDEEIKVKQKQTLIAINDEVIQKLEKDKSSLTEQIANLEKQLSQLARTEKTVVMLEGSQNNLEQPSVTFQVQSYNKIIADHQQVNSRLEVKVHELQYQLSSVAENKIPHENYGNQAKEMEEKLSYMQEDMRLKDEIMLQNERRIEESYVLKYQLADLKEKVSQLESALKERDLYINELEDTKDILSKEIEDLQSFRPRKQCQQNFQIHLEKVDESKKFQASALPQPSEVNDTKIEIQEMKAQLQTLNSRLSNIKNENIQLRTKYEDSSNYNLDLQQAIMDVKAERDGFNKQNNKLHKQIQILTAKLVFRKDTGQSLQTPIEQTSELNNSSSSFEQRLSQMMEQINSKMSQNEDLLKQIKDLTGELEAANAHNAELTLKVTQVEQNVQKLQKEMILICDKSSQISSQEINRQIKEQQDTIQLLNKQLIHANIRIEEFIAQAINVNLHEGEPQPQLQFHTVDSHDEASPLNYSGDHIPLDISHNKEVHSHQETSKKEIQELKDQVASLKLDLSLEQQQKAQKLKQLQQCQLKLTQQQQFIKHIKEQHQKYSALPLQSFDTPRPQRDPQIITEEEKKPEPSIMGILVGSQGDADPHQKQKIETQTRMQTKHSQEQLEFIKKQIEYAKQQLQSQKKLHSQLRELHSICAKKYELLEIRYQNCLQQLDFYQGENQDLIKHKKQAEDGLYDLKMIIAQLQEQNIAVQPEPIAQVIQYDETIKEQVLPVQNIQVKEVMTQPVEEIPQQPIQSNNQTSPIEQQLNTKVRQLENKALTLQAQLQKQLQNQNNQNLSSKLDKLSELEFMIEQCKAQMQEMRKQNDSLKHFKTDYESLIAQKGQLTRLIDDHAQWEQQKMNMQKKITQSQSNSLRFATEKEELQQKVNILSEEKLLLENQHQQTSTKRILQEPLSQSPILDNKDPIFDKKEAMVRQMELIQKMAVINEQKLKHLQKVVELQQKINIIESSNTAKTVQLEQSLITKDHDIQQLKFRLQQLERQIEENKLELNSLKVLNQRTLEGSSPLQQNYTKAVLSLESANADLVNYRQQILLLSTTLEEMKAQIRQTSGQKGDKSAFDQLSSQVDKLQLQIANKVAFIEQLEAKSTELQNCLQQMQSKLNEHQSLLAFKEQKINAIIQEKQEIQKGRQELNQKLKQTEAQLIQTLSKLTTSERQNKAFETTSSSNEISINTFQQKFTKQTSQLTSLQDKLKHKQSQMLKLSKQIQTLKIQNSKHESKIKQLSQKQRQLKDTMVVVESESKKVVAALQQRYKSEQLYYKGYLDKEKQCNRLNAAAVQITQEIGNKERQLHHEQQRAQQLQRQLEVMKAAGEDINPKVVSVQYQKYRELMTTNDQLMNKNRQYLQILGTKSTVNKENQKLKGDIKAASSSLNQLNTQYSQFKNQQDSKILELNQKLKFTEERKDEASDKINSLLQQLTDSKQSKILSQHLFYDNLITEKNNQIEVLRRNISQTSNGVGEQKIESSQISILNEQIMSLNNDILEKETQIVELRQLLGATPPNSLVSFAESPQRRLSSNSETEKLVNKEKQYQKQISQLEVQVLSLRATLSHPKGQKIIQVDPAEPSAGSIQRLSFITSELHTICSEIKILCQQRRNNNDTIFQNFINKYDLMEQQFQNLNIQTSAIQEKARYISKQLQKVKAHIIKSPTKNLKQKQQILGMIKPCENAAGDLVTLSETMSEHESNNFL